MNDTDKAQIRALWQRTNEAWNNADAETFGNAFTEDADYITFVGTHYRGRTKIIDMHDALWRTFLKGSRLTGQITDIRAITDDVAIVTGVGRVQRSRRSSTKPDKTQTYVAVRHHGAWLFAAFHNGKRRPLLEWVANRSNPRLAPDTEPALPAA
jgi:uncharacterized protein (TIGR02246 family)